jgi:hypothetical protein
MNSGQSETPSPQPPSADSPFAIIPPAPEGDAPTSPFSRSTREQWPFRDLEPSEEFGFEAPAPAVSKSPWVNPAEPAPASPLPFTLPSWQQEEVPRAHEAKAENAPPLPAAAEFARPSKEVTTPMFAPPAEILPTPEPAPRRSEVSPEPGDEFASDSQTIRQLELRAIFGMDREMDANEILQRCRALPRILNLARIRAEDVVTIEALKSLLGNLGFGSGALKLQIGAVPLEFIREGKSILAVQSDGGFAPGVRETLILAARELGRMG